MAMKQLPVDFLDFLDSLNSNEVEYLLLGGWAVGIYGFPRATKDIDFLVSIEDGNLGRLQQALHEFGAPPIDINQFKQKGSVFRMGRSPIQIDVISNATGIDFDSCYLRKNTVIVDDTSISVISKEDLIINKQTTGRLQDLADVEKLK